jgi:hypothetical protein
MKKKNWLSMYKTQVNYLKKIYTKQLCQTNIRKEKLDHSEILPNNGLKCVIDILINLDNWTIILNN